MGASPKAIASRVMNSGHYIHRPFYLFPSFMFLCHCVVLYATHKLVPLVNAKADALNSFSGCKIYSDFSSTVGSGIAL